MKRYWWLLIVLTLRISLACDYYDRVLVAELGGEHIDDELSYIPNIIELTDSQRMIEFSF